MMSWFWRRTRSTGPTKWDPIRKWKTSTAKGWEKHTNVCGIAVGQCCVILMIKPKVLCMFHKHTATKLHVIFTYRLFLPQIIFYTGNVTHSLILHKDHYVPGLRKSMACRRDRAGVLMLMVYALCNAHWWAADTADFLFEYWNMEIWNP